MFVIFVSLFSLLKPFIAFERLLFIKFVAILRKKVVVDFRSRMLAFRGAGVEPPSASINFLSGFLLKEINKIKTF
jgi:hypothetical protein